MNRQELQSELEWFCGCGCPEEAARALLKLLRLHPLYDHQAELDELIPDVGMRYLTLYMLDELGRRGPDKRVGWFEHGSSIGGQWLEEKGREVQAALEIEEATDFEELFADHCVHGINIEDDCPECRS